MKYLGTYNTAAEAGERLLRTGFAGLRPGVRASDEAVELAMSVEWSKDTSEGNYDHAEEICIDAIEFAGRRIVLIDTESGETISAEELVKYLDRGVVFEMWGTATNDRPLSPDLIGLPKDGWRDIRISTKHAVADWTNFGLHGQDGQLRLAYLFELLREGR